GGCKGLSVEEGVLDIRRRKLCGGRFCRGRFCGRGRRDNGCDRHHTQNRSCQNRPCQKLCEEDLSGQNARKKCTHGEPPKLMIRKCMIGDELDFVMTAVVC